MTEESGFENSITDIRKAFEDEAKPLKQGEFVEFWQSLTDEEKDEFKNTPLK